MKIILFSNIENEFKNQLITVLETVALKTEIEKYETIEMLSKRLRTDTSDIGIIILSISKTKALTELLMIRTQLIGHRMIIILPHQNHDILSKAHLLYPRFIGYNDNDIGELKSVLEKLLSYLNIHSKMKSIQNVEYIWSESVSQHLFH